MLDYRDLMDKGHKMQHKNLNQLQKDLRICCRMTFIVPQTMDQTIDQTINQTQF